MISGKSEVYACRRSRVLERLGDGAVLVLPAAPELVMGRDTELRYRPDPDLYYLTGYPEPDAVLVLAPSNEAAPYTLFVRPRDPELELWTGVRGGPEAAVSVYGADEAYPLYELEERLAGIVAGADVVYFPFGEVSGPVAELVHRVLADSRKRRQRTGRGPRYQADPGVILDEMRLFKDAHELALLSEAARITAESFMDAASAIRPGAGEWEVEAALEAGFRRRGAEGVAFPSIVGSGVNATVLHYIENSRTMEAGDLLLIDAGARYGMYNGDISRTFPVSGRFSPAQRELYDVVLTAHDRAIEASRPGATIADVHGAAVRSLVEALIGLGLLSGGVDEVIEKQEYRRYYPHQTSHWLGLDVHDVGDYAADDGASRRLEAGMVFTIEPGLYIPADDERAPAELLGLGIRIEDDVVITETGCEILTAAIPATAEAMEELTRGSA